MDLLFNKEVNNIPQGEVEIKATLGFLEGGFNYNNIAPDIKLNTPYLIDMVGQEVYDLIFEYYNDEEVPAGKEEDDLKTALTYMQLYILSMAYLDFAPDNDLNHGNSGRSFRSDDNDKIPWDWQIEKSNSSIKRRAYKALDQLMLLLDNSDWSEWTDSDQYTKANDLLIKNTNEFDLVYPIDKSGQLYYRLVPFMADFEEDNVCAILTADVYNELKEVEDPTAEQKRLILLSKKAVAYLSLGKAYKVLPVEMFPSGLTYQENTKMKSSARAEVMQFLNNEGANYLTKLEYELAQQNQTFEQINPMQGLDEHSKHVSL